MPKFNLQLAQSTRSYGEGLAADWHIAQSQATSGPSSANSAPALPNPIVQNGKPICGISHLVRCIEDLGEDDAGIFTSPFHVKPRDSYWLMPLGAATGLAFAYDRDAQRAAGVDASRTNTANTISDFGSFYATGLEGAGIYFLGLAKKNPKLAETGRLGAEAVIDSGTVTAAIKVVSNRQRPLQGNGHGDFWADGTNHWEWDSSFPSDHATATMALARVISGEYPHWYVMVPAYGFAETISISRLLANQHFPSDIVVGQAIGFLTGTYVLNHHALYRPGKRGLMDRLLGTVTPVTNAQTRTFGASMEIPTTIFRHR
jgi:membrane-associated phospholipid phosphatase